MKRTTTKNPTPNINCPSEMKEKKKTIYNKEKLREIVTRSIKKQTNKTEEHS